MSKKVIDCTFMKVNEKSNEGNIETPLHILSVQFFNLSILFVAVIEFNVKEHGVFSFVDFSFEHLADCTLVVMRAIGIGVLEPLGNPPSDV